LIQAPGQLASAFLLYASTESRTATGVRCLVRRSNAGIAIITYGGRPERRYNNGLRFTKMIATPEHKELALPGQSPPAGSKTLQLLEALKALNNPETGQSVVAQGLVKNISITEGRVHFDLLRDPAWQISDADFSRRAAEMLRDLAWWTKSA